MTRPNRYYAVLGAYLERPDLELLQRELRKASEIRAATVATDSNAALFAEVLLVSPAAAPAVLFVPVPGRGLFIFANNDKCERPVLFADLSPPPRAPVTRISCEALDADGGVLEGGAPALSALPIANPLAVRFRETKTLERPTPSELQRDNETKAAEALADAGIPVDSVRQASCVLHAAYDSGNVSVVVAGTEASLRGYGRVFALDDPPPITHPDTERAFAPQLDARKQRKNTPVPLSAEQMAQVLRTLRDGAVILKLHAAERRGGLSCACAMLPADVTVAVTLHPKPRSNPGRALSELLWPHTRLRWVEQLRGLGATHFLVRVRRDGANDAWGNRRRVGERQHAVAERTLREMGLQDLPQQFSFFPRTQAAPSTDQTSRAFAAYLVL